MVKAVIFDLDDTLLWDKKSVAESFKATCQVAVDKYGVDIEQFEEAVREAARQLYSSYETYEFTKMIGINPFEGLWGNFGDKINVNFRKMKEIVPQYRTDAWVEGLKTIGIDDSAFGAELGELFAKNRRTLPFVYEDTFTLLEELKKDYQLLLLTNGSPELQNEKLDMTPELVPYFDHIVISGAFGRGKPDPAIFKHCLYLTDLTKEEAVMVGDNLHTDIIGSNQIGMRNVWINRDGKDIVDDIYPTYTIKELSELPRLLKEI
ncbi:HAD family hydrolase [Alkalihalobacillus sp. BA299]|uniref:HAD family hydrolase n=1 Tax=Alkalihalobacillus sp. BA299 TaxID=2815938 RepID=UPI001AD9A636|nr:HAD family hydrolase [Alkalihalobacillus sp. BA299]